MAHTRITLCNYQPPLLSVVCNSFDCFHGAILNVPLRKLCEAFTILTIVVNGRYSGESNWFNFRINEWLILHRPHSLSNLCIYPIYLYLWIFLKKWGTHSRKHEAWINWHTGMECTKALLASVNKLHWSG